MPNWKFNVLEFSLSVKSVCGGGGEDEGAVGLDSQQGLYFVIIFRTSNTEITSIDLWYLNLLRNIYFETF